MTNTMAAQLIANRGNRASATLLYWLEGNVRERLSPDEWDATRSMVLSCINDFKDLAMDVVKSDQAMMNDLWVKKLIEIHDELRVVRSKVG